LGIFKLKSVIKYILIVILIATVLFVFFGIIEKDSGDNSKEKINFKNISKYKSEGNGMSYIAFNKKNEKALEIFCDKSEETKDNKILMKKIVAVLEPKSRTKNKIEISGDLGIVEANLVNFNIEGNAKIESKDFSIKTTSFSLRNKYFLNTNKDLDYTTKNLIGSANGMKVHLDTKVFNYLDTVGSYTLKKRIFEYSSDSLRIDDKKQILILKKIKNKRNFIKGKELFVTAQMILTKFTEDYSNHIHTFAKKNSHFVLSKINNEKVIDKKDVKSNVIGIYYNDSGDIDRVVSSDNTRLMLNNEKYIIRGFTNILNMEFYEETQNLKTVRMESLFTRLYYEELNETEGESFKIICKAVDILYNENGEITDFNAVDSKKVKFESKSYFASGKNLKYDLSKETIRIKDNAFIEIDEKREFKSEELIVNTAKNYLRSNLPVISKITLEGSNFLLSDRPVFINADSFRMDRNKKIMKFKGKVNLIQDEISIKAGELVLSDKSGIKCKAAEDSTAIFVFIDRAGEIVIKGRDIQMFKDEKYIEINGKAVINDKENKIKGDNLKIYFNKEEKIERIIGDGNIIFKKDELKIDAESVKWLYSKNVVYFEGLKEIKKKSTGSIKGKRIKLDLKTNTMSGVSEEDERTETVLD